MRQHGFTLLEVVVALSILTVLMATLMSLSLGLGDTARIQEIEATQNDEARAVLLTLVPLLHQAARSSVNWNSLSNGELHFRTAVDLDGNGTAINAAGTLELGTEYVVKRDRDDANGDGKTDTQLVLIHGDRVSVLANHISPLPVVNGAVVDNAPGFRVVAQGGGVQIELQFEGRNRLEQAVRLDITEFVRLRN